jgi:hypothetical protein
MTILSTITRSITNTHPIKKSLQILSEGFFVTICLLFLVTNKKNPCSEKQGSLTQTNKHKNYFLRFNAILGGFIIIDKFF